MAEQDDMSRSLIIKLRLDPKKLRTLLPESEVTTAQIRPKARARATAQPGAGTRTSLRTMKTHDPESSATISATYTHAEANLAEQAADDDLVMEDVAEEESPNDKVTKTDRGQKLQPAKRNRNVSDGKAGNKCQKVVNELDVAQQGDVSQPGADTPMTDAEEVVEAESQIPDTASERQQKIDALAAASLGLMRNDIDGQVVLKRLRKGKHVDTNGLKIGRSTTNAAVPLENIDANSNASGASGRKIKNARRPRGASTRPNIRVLDTVAEQEPEPSTSMEHHSLQSAAAAPATPISDEVDIANTDDDVETGTVHHPPSRSPTSSEIDEHATTPGQGMRGQKAKITPQHHQKAVPEGARR